MIAGEAASGRGDEAVKADGGRNQRKIRYLDAEIGVSAKSYRGLRNLVEMNRRKPGEDDVQ